MVDTNHSMVTNFGSCKGRLSVNCKGSMKADIVRLSKR
jgi:hypothetical protein